MLVTDKVTKRFGGVIAVNNVSLEIESNKITGLIGPNGSGKTTFFNCINGIYCPEMGKIIFDNHNITGLDPSLICRKGIARTFQIVRPFSSLTVKETIEIAMHFGRGNDSPPHVADEVDNILNFVDMYDKRNISSESLILVDRKKLEIARALATDPKLLLLDEVASGLNFSELNEIKGLIYNILEKGVTILIVEHIMHLIMDICNNIIVFVEGHKVAEGTPEEISNNEIVIESYLGKKEKTVAS